MIGGHMVTEVYIDLNNPPPMVRVTSEYIIFHACRIHFLKYWEENPKTGLHIFRLAKVIRVEPDNERSCYYCRRLKTQCDFKSCWVLFLPLDWLPKFVYTRYELNIPKTAGGISLNEARAGRDPEIYSGLQSAVFGRDSFLFSSE